MHVPDGFIAPQIYLPLYVAATGAWAYGLRLTRRSLQEEAIPRLAMLSALALVLMMVAIPLPGGTTVHASGVALPALWYGVWTGFIAVSLVLLIAAMMFGEGGLTTLPLNALAMGLAGSAAACLAFRLLRGHSERAALLLAGWLSVMAPAVLIAITLGVQPYVAHDAAGKPLFFPFGLAVTLPAILIPHAAVGVGEGLLTLTLYRFLRRHYRAPPP